MFYFKKNRNQDIEKSDISFARLKCQTEADEEILKGKTQHACEMTNSRPKELKLQMLLIIKGQKGGWPGTLIAPV